MIFPVVLLLDSQRTLEEVLLLAVVTQVFHAQCPNLPKSLLLRDVLSRSAAP